MGKFSLYNLLAIILPGSFPVLVFAFLYYYTNENPVSYGSGFFELTLYLTASIFCGVLIHIIGVALLSLYKIIGIYLPIIKVFKSSESLKTTHVFFENRCREQFSNDINEENCLESNCDIFYDWMYYSLQVDNKIETAKSFQGFYFFFRNFFTLSLLSLIIIGLVTLSYGRFDFDSTLFFFMLPVFAISWWASWWYRKKMVEKMFWTFFALNNKL